MSDIKDESESGYLSGADLAARFRDEETSGQYWIRSGIAGFADGPLIRVENPVADSPSFRPVPRKALIRASSSLCMVCVPQMKRTEAMPNP